MSTPQPYPHALRADEIEAMVEDFAASAAASAEGHALGMTL